MRNQKAQIHFFLFTWCTCRNILEVWSKEVIGNVSISYFIILFGIKISLIFVLLIYYLCCLTIYCSENVFILTCCIVIFGILDQSIWILTTYVISCLYPVKTNLLISACFTGISFSIFIWANFSAQFINRDNVSMGFIFDLETTPPVEMTAFISRFKQFFLFHGFCFLLLIPLVVRAFNIEETSKINIKRALHSFYENCLRKWCCRKNPSVKNKTFKPLLAPKYKVNSLFKSEIFDDVRKSPQSKFYKEVFRVETDSDHHQRKKHWLQRVFHWKTKSRRPDRFDHWKWRQLRKRGH